MINQPALVAFYAANSDIFGNIATYMPYFTAAAEVWLDQNPKLTGTLPSLESQTSLQSFSVTECSIQGSIPPSIDNMTQLKQIWLYKNQMTGTIPSSIGNLLNLKTFASFGNQMNGAMPGEVCALKRSRLKDLEVDCAVDCQCCTCCGDACDSGGRRLLEKKRWL